MRTATFRVLALLLLGAAGLALCLWLLADQTDSDWLTGRPYGQPVGLALSDFLPEPSQGQLVRYPIPEEMPQPILVYHHIRPDIPAGVSNGLVVTPTVFEEQLKWLRDSGWQTVTFSDYIDAMDGLIQLPDKAVVITFDDGNRNQYEHALPLLKRYQTKATFFIYPNAIGRRDDFMNWTMVKELVAAGMEIGSHSRTHPRLYKMTDYLDIEREVLGSKQWLERELAVPVKAFAYPFGVAGIADQSAVQLAGYQAARIYPYGPRNTPFDRFKLKSVAAPNSLVGLVRLLQ